MVGGLTERCGELGVGAVSVGLTIGVGTGAPDETAMEVGKAEIGLPTTILL